MQEVDNVIRILKGVLSSIRKGDVSRIKHLSNETIHSATISQDPDNLIVAVLVYSVGKVMERSHYHEMEGWDAFHKSLIKNLQEVVDNLEKNNIEKARVDLGEIRNSIAEISGNLRIYISDVFRKAEINKAFKIYEHGLSAEKTAEMLGISLWELSSYIGQSSISEASVTKTLPIKERIKFVEEIFDGA